MCEHYYEFYLKVTMLKHITSNSKNKIVTTVHNCVHLRCPHVTESTQGTCSDTVLGLRVCLDGAKPGRQCLALRVYLEHD